MLLYLLEERMVQEGAGTWSAEKAEERPASPLCPRLPKPCCLHLILRQPLLLPSASGNTTARVTQDGSLVNPCAHPSGHRGSGLLQEPSPFRDRCVLLNLAFDPPPPAPHAPPKAHCPSGEDTLRLGCAEGTAPRSGGSEGRRCGDRGGTVSRHWRSWGCWGPSSHSGPSWLLSARC